MFAKAIDFDEVTKGLRTKSDKIRALAREGAATADIARYLGIKYQHARNVLVSSGLHTRRDEQSGETETDAATGELVAWVRIDALGRLQIPAGLMKAAGLAGDEPVHVGASEDGIEILSRRAALRRAHDIARQFVPEGVSLVDELIAERRREAERENG
jgi:bifunctional DNA-binding transcriptional regulator/antitoxin component of YhaV-PrlF toxin-antitoxin module